MQCVYLIMFLSGYVKILQLVDICTVVLRNTRQDFSMVFCTPTEISFCSISYKQINNNTLLRKKQYI